MLFRGRQPEASVWRRFRAGSDDFTFAEQRDHYEACVAASAERVVDLLHALAEHLPPAVDVAIDDARSGRRWLGVNVALPDAREAVARLKVPLAAYGGAELSIYSTEDQVTVTADLELWIFSRTDRWLYILQGIGLHEATALRPESWRVAAEELGEAPELDEALRAAAERLGLELRDPR
jgi:hypothetical protein